MGDKLNYGIVDGSNNETRRRDFYRRLDLICADFLLRFTTNELEILRGRGMTRKVFDDIARYFFNEVTVSQPQAITTLKAVKTAAKAFRLELNGRFVALCEFKSIIIA